MTADERVARLEEFLAERGQPLLRVAALLGGGPEAGEDLLQAALERLLQRWRDFEGDPPRVTCAALFITWPPTSGAASLGGSPGCRARLVYRSAAGGITSRT